MWNMRRILQIAAMFALTVLDHTSSFNVDQTTPIIYNNNPAGSYFGYSVLLHENRQGKWVLAGAPKANSQFQPTIRRPGAIFKCTAPTVAGARPVCMEVKLDDKGNERSPPGTKPYVHDAKDNQWLGVSLARQKTRGLAGKVTACAHKWSNEFFKATVKVILVNGACFEIDAEFDFETVNKTRPCLFEVQIKADSQGKGVAWHGWCQAGFSATYSIDSRTLILGAVGSLAWRGSVVSIINAQANVADVSSWYPPDDKDESYVGYAVGSGHFSSRSSVDGVTGAPRAYEKGQVYIYNLQDFTLISSIKGESMNTYFGAAVLGIDLNRDGLTDLLVGAPQYSEDQDEGRVYIFINEGMAIMRKLDVKLVGSNSVGARFGSVIESLGDINRDGFEDVAIGAPYENNNRGAVYIYLGGEYGLRKPYSQRLTGSSVNPNLMSFGSSISGGIDMDNNGYNDIVIGAYANDTAALYLSKAVIDIESFITLTPSLIDINKTACMQHGKPVSCLHIMACVKYTGASVPNRIGLDYVLEVDHFKITSGLPPRMTLVKDGMVMGSKLTRNIQLAVGQQNCYEIDAHMKKDMKDFLTPVPFRLSHKLRTQPGARYITQCGRLCPTISPYSDSSVGQMASFIHNCGNDSKCVTDLQLTADVIIPRGTKYLPLGSADNIYVMVDLQNRGEEAHQAQVIIEHPLETTFVRVETNRQDAIVLCLPQAPNMTASLLCDVDNPMKANSGSSFRVKLSVPTADANSRNIDIVVTARTSSTEYNSTLYNNVQKITVPIRIEADVTISGVSHPNSLLYGQPKTQAASTPDKATIESQMDSGMPLIPSENVKFDLDKHIGPSLRHIYDARNLGPSNLPFMTSVNISVPWKTKSGDMLLYFSNIEMKGTGTCDIHSLMAQQSRLLQTMLAQRNTTANPEETPNNGPVASALFGSNKNKRLTCSNTECAYIACTVDTLEQGGGAVVEFSMRIFEDTFLNEDLGKIELVAEGMIGVDDPLRRHIQPTSNRPDLVKIVTLIYTESSVSNKPVPKWVIAVSIAAGIVCLVAVILVMWKCGFFRRRMREEMERLIQEKDERESLSPEGLLNDADYPEDNFRSY